MNELPKFRRIEEIQKYLDDMRQEVEVTDKLVVKQQSLLSKLLKPTPKLTAILAGVEFDVSPRPSKTNELKRMVKTIDPSLSKVVIPNISNLQSQYGLMEDLHDKYSKLERMEMQLQLQFPDSNSPAFNKALGSITSLKREVEKQLQAVFKFLNEVAEKHVPSTFKEYVEAIQAKVEEHVYFEDSSRYLYVSVKDKELLFTEYMLLTDSVSDEGKIAPQLYIVVQWVVGKLISVFVEHEFTPPNQLAGGSEVSSVKEAVAAIAHDLAIEGFSSYLGTIPMSLGLSVTPDQLKPSMFSVRDYLGKIEPSADMLSFKFRNKSYDEETRKKIAMQLFPEFKALTRNKKTKLRMRITKASIDFFIGNMPDDKKLSTADVDFLKDRFGLSDNAVAKIAVIVAG